MGDSFELVARGFIGRGTILGVCYWILRKQYAINGWLYNWLFVFLRFTNGED